MEAAYLLPMIFFLIWNVLFVSFFVYDQTVMLQGSYCTALRTERMRGTEEEKQKEAEYKFRESVAERVVCGHLEHQLSVTEETVIVKTKLEMNPPGGHYFQGFWQGAQQQSAEKWKPVAFIRDCRKTENILQLLQSGNTEVNE